MANYSNLERRYTKEDLEAIIGKAQELYNKTKDSYDKETISSTAMDLDIPKEYIDKAISVLKEENAIKEKEKKTRTVFIAIGAAVLVITGIIVVTSIINSTPDSKLKQMRDAYYNEIVRIDEAVKTQAAQVENVMERRFELIPKLESVVREYAQYEKGVLAQMNDAKNQFLSAKSLTEKSAALDKLDLAIITFTKSADASGQIKANELYQSLLFEISGSDNRISVEKKRYNDAVAAYNSFVKQYPLVDYIDKLGFEKQKEYWSKP